MSHTGVFYRPVSSSTPVTSHLSTELHQTANRKHVMNVAGELSANTEAENTSDIKQTVCGAQV